MPRSTGRRCPPATRSFTALALAPAPASNLSRLRRRIRSPAAAGAWPRMVRTATNGQRSAPTTPLVKWKRDSRTRTPGPRNVAGDAAATPSVTARRLAAGIWRIRRPEIGGGTNGHGSQLGLQPNPGHLGVRNVCGRSRLGIHGSTSDRLPGYMPALDRRQGIFPEVEACTALFRGDMEMATKWDRGCSKTANEVHEVFGQLKILESKSAATHSTIDTLQAELWQAHNHITELEAEKKSTKKKLDDFLKKLAEEKALWRSREHKKVHNIIDAIKEDLSRERKNMQRLEIVNSKLVNELAETKLSAKRYFQDLEKERKAHELMEEVCDELAKEIAEDKAEIDALKAESMKIREEVEEERKMLQMAEVWREERVQLKLVDAKLTLEHKHSQLSKLKDDLETFLGVQSSSSADAQVVREAEKLKEAASRINIDGIKEFSYQPPPASEDIFSVLQELQPREGTNGEVVDQGNKHSPVSDASIIHTASPETDEFLERPIKRYANRADSVSGDLEDDSGWETMSHADEHGSSNSLEGSDPSVNGMCEENNPSVSGTDWDANDENGMSEISGVCSTTPRQYRKKGSSIARLWRPSNEVHNRRSVKLAKGMLLNGRISNATASPDPRLGQLGKSTPGVVQWSSPDSINPHLTQGINGRIEWLHGLHKHSLKAKLSEAQIENKKIQLQHALKQKI